MNTTASNNDNNTNIQLLRRLYEIYENGYYVRATRGEHCLRQWITMMMIERIIGVIKDRSSSTDLRSLIQ
jgi:hypothetical protein